MTDIEFHRLLELAKSFDSYPISLPIQGSNATYNISSTSIRDSFLLDVDRRSKIELKHKTQCRYEITKLPLVRIDFNGSPHINPDGRRLGRAHVHIYREVENDTGNLPWAYDLNEIEIFRSINSTSTFMDVFSLFCIFCNISTIGVQGVI